ncbi:MAG: AMP-binding protein [Acidobacteriota bacterium]
MAPRDFPEIDPEARLADLLERAARHFPSRGVAVFDGRGRRRERRTYPEVLAAARRASGRWSALGVRPGDRVLIGLPTSWSWLDAWLGAVLLGALPVAVAPGAAMGAARAQLEKVDGLVERLGVRFALVGDAFRGEAEAAGLRRASEAALGVGELEGTTPDPLKGASEQRTRSASEDVAFLQLTSGSTGVPRAVMISHRAALHNAWANDRAIGVPHGAPTHRWADSMVSWLPLHHDMGLVGCLFLSIYAGLDLWLFQGTTFLARPRLWLEHLGLHGTAFAPAPNFGYQLCLERLTEKDREGLDLSSWHDAMTGAEMIRPETVAGFCETFAPYGFRPEAFRPCFGLAEGTLAVTFDGKGRGMRTLPMPESAGEGQALGEVVCVGEAIDDTVVRVCGPDGRPLPDGEIGEVRVQGPGVFLGYWNDPGATAEGLQDGWLCTGDLGFLHRGELYLTGRLKDILILRGHNLMPHEIEWQAEAVTGGGGGLRSGAFSVARGTAGEEAVLVVETTAKGPGVLASMAGDIRNRVGRTLSILLSDIVFVRRGRIPKTTSGKVQRRQLRDQYLSGSLDALARFEPPST